jgi:hypothetical protein
MAFSVVWIGIPAWLCGPNRGPLSVEQNSCKTLFREKSCNRSHERFGRRWLNPRFGIFETDVDPSTPTDGLWWVKEDRRNVALFAQAYFA